MPSLYSFSGQLDRARAALLRVTLADSRLRTVFRARALRLRYLFAAACFGALVSSLYFPLVVLLVGPILYGLPHLFAGLRYVGRQVSITHQRTAIFFFSALFFAVALCRVLCDLHYLSLPAAIPINGPETIALILTFVGCGLLFPPRRGLFIGGTALAAIAYFSWTRPAVFVGAMLLLHNLVGFGYWIAAARPKDRVLPIGATLIFIALSLLILAGKFDFVYAWLDSGSDLAFANLNYLQLGQSIFPRSESATLWYHAVVAYAFGQSLHYFVWLKAIPEQCYEREAPPSFRQSLYCAQNEFGPRYFQVVIGLVLVASAGWFLVSMPVARLVYFSIAAYHGYLELAGLVFALASGKRAP